MELFAFDDDYVRRLRARDRETEAHFYEYFRELLLLTLRRRVHSMQAIDEIRQEIFVRVLDKLGDLRDGRKLGAFVIGVCNHVVMEYWRGESRTEPLEPARDEPASSAALEEEQDRRMSSARVKRVLAALEAHNPRDSDILRAVFLDDSDKDEICRRFDIDRGYLRVLLHRAKDRFRAEYLRRESGRREIRETFGADPSLSSQRRE